MKHIACLVLVLFSATLLLTGCGAFVMTPAMGGLYTKVKAPLIATSNAGYSKVGTAECNSIFGLIATGDASIETACKNAGITKIHHVDFESTNILGIIAKMTVYVYGE